MPRRWHVPHNRLLVAIVPNVAQCSYSPTALAPSWTGVSRGLDWLGSLGHLNPLARDRVG